MKLKTAIELIEENNPPVMDSWSEELTKAVSLLIEAGKEIQRLHESQVMSQDELLPGETEES